MTNYDFRTNFRLLHNQIYYIYSGVFIELDGIQHNTCEVVSLTHAHTLPHANIHNHMQTYIHTHTYMQTYIHTRTANIHTHAYMQTQPNLYVYFNTCALTHAMVTPTATTSTTTSMCVFL